MTGRGAVLATSQPLSRAGIGCQAASGKGVSRAGFTLVATGRASAERLDGAWIPDAFVGTMASIMRFAPDESACLPTSDVEPTGDDVELSINPRYPGATLPPA